MSEQALRWPGPYPEREDRRGGLLDRWVAAPGQRLRRLVERHARHPAFVQRVNGLEAGLRALGDDALSQQAAGLRVALRRPAGPATEEALARCFALVREVARRRIGMRHFDGQLVGGRVLLDGHVAEMDTGEGKTLTATLAASASALAGVPVHVITVNDYLAERDAQTMGPVYQALGLRVGCILHDMAPPERRAVYGCDVVYCSNKEIAFDYLRDRLVLRGRPRAIHLQVQRLGGAGGLADRLVMRGLRFAIVDEADSVLIDEARTPLIISADSPDPHGPALYRVALDCAGALEEGLHFRLPAGAPAELTEAGQRRVAESGDRFGTLLTGAQRREQMVTQALAALHLYRRDQHYIVREGKVEIVDENTGRVLEGRSWEQGLHQLIEIKEGCALQPVRDTLARISYQRFFRRYLRLSGMTGTATEVRRELRAVYGLDVVRVPTRLPLQRQQRPMRLHATAQAKWADVVAEIQACTAAGRPVLVGTRSVAASEHLSALLGAAAIEHRLLNARQDKHEAEVVAHAGSPGCVTVATNMAGRGTDIRLEPGVAARGGLHVIATELHESGRVDRQLFGRCARQGDPGSTRAIVSLEDELLTRHGVLPAAGIEALQGLLRRPALGRLLFRLAQQRAGRSHARIRRALLASDDFLGDLLAFAGRRE